MTPDWAAARKAAETALAPWAGAPGPGGAIVLFDRDGVRGEAAAGQASLSHGLPFTAGTRARFASITKHVFCAFALRHGLALDDPLGALLPGLSPAFAAVPVARALSMTGALPDLLQSYTLCGLPYSALVDLDRLDAFCDRLDACNGLPGEEIVYSNTGYRLVERGLARAGHPFGPWVEETVNTALGTALRYPAHWDRPLDGLAEGYWRAGPQAPWRTGAYGPGLSASGALTGSARDLALWLAALLRGDGPAGGTLEQLSRPQPLADGRATGYGLGLLETPLGRHRLIGHGGSLPGFKNEILFDRASGAGVVLLSNREDTDPQAMALVVMAALLGEDLPAPPPPEGLPRGLFVEDQGPAWIELDGAGLTFLGTAAELGAGPTPGTAVSHSSYMPVDLRLCDDGAIAGAIGHAPRCFRSVAADAALSPAMAGLWRNATDNATLEIRLDGTGGGSAGLGLGPLHRSERLVPLDATRALMPVGAAPWASRACLWLETPGTLRLATHRSRILTLARIA